MPCILYIANAVTSLQSSVSLGPQNSYLDYFFFPCGSFFFSHMYEFLYVITRAINRNSCHAPGSKALGQVTCTLLIDLSNLSFSICAWCEALWMEQIEENSIIHSHEKRSDRKQDNFLGWSCIKKKKKKVVDLALRVSLLDAVS